MQLTEEIWIGVRCTGKKTVLAGGVLACLLSLSACGADDTVASYEKETYNTDLYRAELFAEDLCVTSQDVSVDGFSGDSTLHGAGLFNVTDRQVVYGQHLFDRLYPASTTKILTALVAIKNSNLDDVVTVSSTASASSFSWDASVAGIQTGDRLTMRDLLYGLMLPSGNDSAVAIAEYVGGTEEHFMEMVNAEAQNLLATGTHFVTPNGLHDENHYTTPYDLYLIFNECIQYEEFINIISAPSYTAQITGADGTVRSVTWEPTSFYARGEAALPTGANVIGGKTGYTGEAGNCLVLLDQAADGDYYISIVMGAQEKPLLYEDMTAMIDLIPAQQQE